jgi:hypothetical protein
MKLYVVTSKNLSKSQQWVQAAHAAIQFTMNLRDKLDRHPSLVILKGDVEYYKNLFNELSIDCAWFNEPHYNNQLTAVAALNVGELVKDLNLLRS